MEIMIALLIVVSIPFVVLTVVAFLPTRSLEILEERLKSKPSEPPKETEDTEK